MKKKKSGNKIAESTESFATPYSRANKFESWSDAVELFFALSRAPACNQRLILAIVFDNEKLLIGPPEFKKLAIDLLRDLKGGDLRRHYDM